MRMTMRLQAIALLLVLVLLQPLSTAAALDHVRGLHSASPRRSPPRKSPPTPPRKPAPFPPAPPHKPPPSPPAPPPPAPSYSVCLAAPRTHASLAQRCQSLLQALLLLPSTNPINAALWAQVSEW